MTENRSESNSGQPGSSEGDDEGVAPSGDGEQLTPTGDREQVAPTDENEQVAPTEDGDPSSSTDAETTVKKWYGAVGSQDWERMRELMTADFQNHYPPSIEDEPMGRDELIDFFKHFEWWLNIHDIFSSGDKVAVRVRVTNRQVAEFEGLPPSDEKRSVEGTVIWRVADGQVAEAWAFPDTHSMLDQMGLTFPQILWKLPGIIVRKLLS